MLISVPKEPRSCSVVLVPVRAGTCFRVDSPPGNAMVTRQLARELERVLERFAKEADIFGGKPIGVFFKPGIFGHHKVGRAADIYAVGGLGLDVWKRRWDSKCAARFTMKQRRALLENECRQNLGWRLYKALQNYGNWSQPCGYPIQLFGPWTRSEGPWRCISDFLLNAHRDHIHVAK